MPDAARFLIKTSLVHLVVALLLSGMSAAFPWPAGAWPGAAVYPSALHLLTVGWLTQLIFGVAYWLFPRWSKERPHGPVWVIWTVFVLLNAGLILRIIAEPYAAMPGREAWLTASAIAQATAGILFAGYIWNRVKVK